jgi:hypothetical protein
MGCYKTEFVIATNYQHACDGGWWAARVARRSVWGALKFNVGASMTASAKAGAQTWRGTCSDLSRFNIDLLL